MAPEEAVDTDFGVISLEMWLKVKEVNYGPRAMANLWGTVIYTLEMM